MIVPSRKTDDSGKSGRKVEIKENIYKQKGRKSQLSTQLEKKHEQPNLLTLKAMIKYLLGWKVKIKILLEISASRMMTIWFLMTWKS